MDDYEIRALELESDRVVRYTSLIPNEVFWNDFERYIADAIRANRLLSKTYLRFKK